MCGICGFTIGRDSAIDSRETIGSMCDRLSHRGPDDSGRFVDQAVAFGHRRLSIIDLSAGQQPMVGESGAVLVFNGEIYNYRQLRQQLIARGRTFQTDSDTEVILHAYEEFGDDLCSHLNGMFAFAIWDPRSESMLLARDHMGQKPLYYCLFGGQLAFASEPKALFCHPELHPELDRDVLSLYLMLEYVPAPFCLLKGVHKLEAGHVLTFRNGTASKRRYWSLQLNSDTSAEPPADYVEALGGRIEAATSLCMAAADVPVGVFLSGGVDSSLITAYAARGGGSLDTFSIGFDDASYDESHFAAQVAAHLGSRHHCRQLGSRALLDLVPRVADLFDEPLADPSVFPTYLLAEFASESVKVCLGGDGGDELFAGYGTFMAESAASRFQRLPNFMQRLAYRAGQCLPVSHGYFSIDFKVNRFLRGAHLGASRRFPAWLGAFMPDERKRLLIGDMQPTDWEQWIERQLASSGLDDNVSQMLWLYARLYLAGDILVKTDRAAMAHGLEVRAPLLDHNVVAYAASLPISAKFREKTTKIALKKVAESCLPRNIVYRRKQGFGIPVGSWLRGELREWVNDSLSEAALARSHVFDPRQVQQMLNLHQSGRVNYRKEIWTLLMFQLWFDRWIG